jgi:phosphoribosylglycinamide formyltransferase 1
MPGVDFSMTFPLERPARLAVFASGRGTNLRSLLAAFPVSDPLASIVLVVSNKAEAGALALARRHGVPAYAVVFGRDRAGFEREAGRLLGEFKIDLVCLAGFMRVLSPAFVQRYAGRLLNVHPSLLPAFPGLHAQRQALAAGVRESGCTVHFVDAGVDTGEAIVQRRVPVLPDDSEETLTERILVEEHLAYPDAVRRVLTGRCAPHAVAR